MRGISRVAGWCVCAGVALLVSQQPVFASTGEFLNNYDFSDIDEFGMAVGWDYPAAEGQSYNFMSPEANKYMITVDETEYHTAPHSMLITVTNASTQPNDGHFAQGVKAPTRLQGQTITVSAWVKAEILGGEEAGFSVVVHTGKSAPSPVWWEHLDWHVAGYVSGTTGWTQVTEQFTISPEATSATLRFYVGEHVAANSKIWIDGVTISAPGVSVRPSLTREQFTPVSAGSAFYSLNGRLLEAVDIRQLPVTNGAVISTMGGQQTGVMMLR